ncbi:hypothetical protein CDAR_97391 [Caerostris darwini]|uniref:Uncharacterized protein n=1 Tax=Caerostris darwini TaxID=1538125 RepID=A0AAV4PNV5_9ARAC|nr:hypothetical protein CDAR_97391 [Caerostris darwini]
MRQKEVIQSSGEEIASVGLTQFHLMEQESFFTILRNDILGPSKITNLSKERPQRRCRDGWPSSLPEHKDQNDSKHAFCRNGFLLLLPEQKNKFRLSCHE